MSVSAQHDTPTIDRAPPAVPSDPIWRFSVRQYHDMIRAGILTEGDPVELLDGWLVPKMTKNPPHCAATRLVRKALEQILPDEWYVRSQDAITLAQSEPEPDAAVVRGDHRTYVDRHPGPKDVALVVEVADASLQRDRTSKKRLYAQAGIPVYWIVNLVERSVEVFTDPSGPTDEPDYRQHRSYSTSEEVPLVVAGREAGRIAASAMLPRTTAMTTTRSELLKVLSELSDACPEMRMGQLIANLATLARGAAVEGIWDAEDDELLGAARRQAEVFRARRAGVA